MRMIMLPGVLILPLSKLLRILGCVTALVDVLLRR
jgi:hypothetical protein